MEKSTANHFLILFRDSSCQFRAVYTMNPETEELVRLTGIGPRVISLSVVESIYKYSSDRKQFSVIPSKTMSMSVDAFTIPGQLWQTKRPGTPKKLGTPKWSWPRVPEVSWIFSAPSFSGRAVQNWNWCNCRMVEFLLKNNPQRPISDACRTPRCAPD